MDMMSRLVRVTNIAPQDTNGATAGQWISLKNFNRLTVLVTLGALNAAADVALRLRQATAVAGTGAKNLLFSHIWRPCGELAYNLTAGIFQVGEVVTGDGGTTGIIHSIQSNRFVLHTYDGVYVDGEGLTGGTSGATATADGVLQNAGGKCRVALAAAAATYIFNNQLGHRNQCFEIDVDPASLDKANSFDCVQMDVTAGTTASVIGIEYLLEPKYAEEPQKTPFVN